MFKYSISQIWQLRYCGMSRLFQEDKLDASFFGTNIYFLLQKMKKYKVFFFIFISIKTGAILILSFEKLYSETRLLTNTRL
jgi:hypothetical protein